MTVIVAVGHHGISLRFMQDDEMKQALIGSWQCDGSMCLHHALSLMQRQMSLGKSRKCRCWMAGRDQWQYLPLEMPDSRVHTIPARDVFLLFHPRIAEHSSIQSDDSLSLDV